jgi:hypothetical protein
MKADHAPLGHALAVAAGGLRVFPCNAEKRPLVETGFKAATLDPRQIQSWWREFPRALIGVPTGAASGFFVVDLDGVEHGGPCGLVAWDKLTANHAAPPTRMHETPNGGAHLLFRYDPARPVTNGRGALPDGIDIRGEGGYVIWPPSRLADGRAWRVPDNCETDAIADAPDWLYALLAEKAAAMAPSHIWKSKDHDYPCTPTGVTDTHADGTVWVEIRSPLGQTFVPQNELVPFQRGSGDGQSAQGKGNGAYAEKALANELAAVLGAPRGQRNETVNRAAFSLGQLVGSGALSGPDVEERLFGAAIACGLAAEDGERRVRATIRSGLDAGMRRPRDIPERNNGERPQPEPPPPGEPPDRGAPPISEQVERRPKDPAALGFIWHGEDDGQVAEDWLVDEALLGVGVALIPGQWGTYKSFVALDLAASVMTRSAFAGREVRHQGGTLWLAAEGQSQMPVRLKGIAREKIAKAEHGDEVKKVDPERMPFVWRKSCPRLTDDDSRAELKQLIAAAAKEMRERFDLKLAVVVIDAVTSAANFKDANDTSEAARVMNMLHSLAQEFEVLIVAIDHFGKDASTGTRNSSAKEDLADCVLALLGEKDITGAVSNPRMALRKVRGGPTGAVIAIEPRSIVIGQDDRGRDVTTLVIDWRADGDDAAPKPDAKKERPRPWAASLESFMRALDFTLAACGKKMRPFADGPELLAVDLDLVRGEFSKSYVVKGRSGQPASRAEAQEAKSAAFTRAVRDADHRNLIRTRETGEPPLTYVWRL